MDIASEQLTAICCKAFPERSGLKVGPLNPLESSQHAMAAFRLESDDAPPQPVIFRRYTSPLGWHRLEDPDRAGREQRVLGWLSGEGFPVPEVYAAGSDDLGGWLLMEALPGRGWWHPLGLVDFKRVLPGIVKQQVALMVRLHTLEPEPLQAQDTLLPVITAAGVLETYRAVAEHVARRSVDEGILVAALRRVADLFEEIEERPPRLINGDAALTNIIVLPGEEQPAWLDWDEAALGDPRWDIAALVESLHGAYQMEELAGWAAQTYARDTLRSLKNLDAWVALRAVIRWAQCAWLQDQIRARRSFDFPSLGRFLDAYDSHRAWAMEMLKKAENTEESL